MDTSWRNCRERTPTAGLELARGGGRPLGLIALYRKWKQVRRQNAYRAPREAARGNPCPPPRRKISNGTGTSAGVDGSRPQAHDGHRSPTRVDWARSISHPVAACAVGAGERLRRFRLGLPVNCQRRLAPARSRWRASEPGTRRLVSGFHESVIFLWFSLVLVGSCDGSCMVFCGSRWFSLPKGDLKILES